MAKLDNHPNRAAKRDRSRRRGEARKAERIADQQRRAKVNSGLRVNGLPTAWEEAKAARHARRHPQPKADL